MVSRYFHMLAITPRQGIRGNRPSGEDRPWIARSGYCDRSRVILCVDLRALLLVELSHERLTCWLRADVIHQDTEVCRIGKVHVGRLNCCSTQDKDPQRRGHHMSGQW